MIQTLRIGYLPILDHLTLGVALNQEELNVEPVQFQNWAVIAAALESGDIDGAFLLFPLALDLERRVKNLKLLLLGHREGQVLTVKPEIQTLTNLRGRIIRLPHEFSTHRVLLHEALREVGLKLGSDVRVEFGYADIRTAADELESSTVDGFMLAEPMGSQAHRRGIGHSLTLSGEVQPHHIDCVLLLNRHIVVEFPKACQTLIDSLVRAGGFINAYPRQAAEIGSQFLGWPAPLLREALSHDRGHILYWDLLPRLEDFETLQQIAVDELRLWPDVIDLTDFIDSRFAQRAYREWVIDVRQETKDKGQMRTLPGTLQEALGQVAHRFEHPLEAVGLTLIRPGKEYPQDAQRLSLQTPIAELIHIAHRESIVVETDRRGVKAIALQPLSDSAVWILLKVTEDEMMLIEESLRFGRRPTEPSAPQELKSLNILFEQSRPWTQVIIDQELHVLIQAKPFRFLPLLLQRKSTGRE